MLDLSTGSPGHRASRNKGLAVASGSIVGFVGGPESHQVTKNLLNAGWEHSPPIQCLSKDTALL